MQVKQERVEELLVLVFWRLEPGGRVMDRF